MAAKKTAAKKTAKKVPARKTAKKKAADKPPSAKAAGKPAEKAPAKKAAVAPKAPKAAGPRKASSKKAPATTGAAKPVKKATAKEVPVANKKTAKASPKKMSSFVAKQQRRLLDLRDELVDTMSGMAGEIRNAPEGSEASGSGMHQGDAGSDAYDRDFALSVLAKEQDALYEIEQALKRIERGVYGICELSGNKIPNARLEAIPFARLTVECQAQWEKEYGKQRFRPKSEIGFSNGFMGEEDSESVSLDETEE